jgi:hypothetical protein
MGSERLLGWSLTPEGDHVTVTAQYPFDVQTTGAALAGWLRNLVACTEAYWRVLPSRQPVAEILSLVSRWALRSANRFGHGYRYLARKAIARVVVE